MFSHYRIQFFLVIAAIIATVSYSALKLAPQKNSNKDSTSFFNCKPDSTSYIYAPGMLGTEILMGRYCPSFVASTGEKITWNSGGHTIGQPHTAVRFPESNLAKPCFTLNPFKAFINSYRNDLFPLIQRTLQEMYNFNIEENPASAHSVINYTFNFSQANLGQWKDINCLCKTYKKHRLDYPNTDIVLYGDSRGGTTIFNFIATHKPQRVKAAILEGVFDNIGHCIKHFLFSNKSPAQEEKIHNMLSFCIGNYDKNGICPRTLVNTISDDIPLLFVTSLKDGLVPPQSTMYLYTCLKARGFKKIHLLVLQKSLHPCYMIGDADDKNLYETVTHAFYKQYGLAYDEQKAIEGKKTFEKTQPSTEELTKLYHLPQCSLCEASK